MKRRYLVLLLAAVLVVGLLPQTITAADRTQEGAAQALKTLGLMQGADGSEQLERNITRLESLVLTVRLMGEESTALEQDLPHPFEDVPKWAGAYVGFAQERGLVQGASETGFGCDEPMQPEQFLGSIMQILGYAPPSGEAAAAAQTAGIYRGEGNAPLSRAEAASICWAALQTSVQGRDASLAELLLARGVFTSEALEKARQEAVHPGQRTAAIDRNYKFYAPSGRGEKVVYLTFDDGPSANVTPKVLDILKENGVHATFFVLGSMADKYPELVKRAYDEGHTIANHSYSHNYKALYAGASALTEEIERTNQSINKALGFDYGNHLFRFPGGSSGKSRELKSAVYDLGFQYVDWNCSSGDAASKKGASAAQILKSTVDTAGNRKAITVLCHDAATKASTAEALPDIIRHFKEQGYTFKTLDAA